jgi:hypothetical protein
MFFHELHVGDGHAAVHRFAHVVHGQQSHLYGGEGFKGILKLRFNFKKLDL